MAQNLHQNFAGLQQQLQQHPQQPNLGHLNQFMPQQQQARPQVSSLLLLTCHNYMLVDIINASKEPASLHASMSCEAD